MAERFDELTAPPIEGTRYWVPCVRAKWGVLGDLAWWPVMGPKHDDLTNLGFKWVHYHINRFFTKNDGYTELSYPIIETDIGHPWHRENCHLIIEYRLRTCRRSRIVPFPELRSRGSEQLFAKLHTAFHGQRCAKTDGVFICPHKGANLGIVLPDAFGERICPLHGLRINHEGVVL